MFLELQSCFKNMAIGCVLFSSEVIVAAEESHKDCLIWLEQFEVGGETREMPCKHRSCLLCLFVMPLEEEEEEDRIFNMLWTINKKEREY